MVESGHVFIDVEAVNRIAHPMKKGGVKIVDRPFFDVGILTGFEATTGIAEQHKRPSITFGMLFSALLLE